MQVMDVHFIRYYKQLEIFDFSSLLMYVNSSSKLSFTFDLQKFVKILR